MVYEYECKNCGQLQIEQRIIDPPTKLCPYCNKEIKRLISKTDFILKGDGWYKKNGY
jgi:putative FmdB family regulatory protein